MDELPDLPEFKRSGASHDSSMSPTPGSAVVSSGGALKRMLSTPLSTSFSFSPTQSQQRPQDAQSPSSTSWPALKSEDQSLFTFGQQKHEPHSPSLSPGAQSPREGYISDSLMSRIGSPPPQHSIPSPPVPKYSSGSGHSSSKSSTRARKIASSPSLGASFQRFGFPPDGAPPVPPVPSIHQQRRKDRSPDGRSGMNESSYPPRSEEDMELSGEELDPRRASQSMTRPRRHGSGDYESHREVREVREGEMDLDDEMYGRATHEGYHRGIDSHRARDHHGHGRGIRPGHELEEDEDERNAFLMSGDVVPERDEGRRKNLHMSRTAARHRPRERFEYDHDNRDDNLINGEGEEVKGRYVEEGAKGSRLLSDGQQGRGRDLDRVGDGRMGGGRGSQPPLSYSKSTFGGSDHLQTSEDDHDDHDIVNRSKNGLNTNEDDGADRILNTNEDPKEAVGMAMVPNHEPRTRQPQQRLWHMDESQRRDKSVDGGGGATSPEDSAMEK